MIDCSHLFLPSSEVQKKEAYSKTILNYYFGYIHWYTQFIHCKNEMQSGQSFQSLPPATKNHIFRPGNLRWLNISKIKRETVMKWSKCLHQYFVQIQISLLIFTENSWCLMLKIITKCLMHNWVSIPILKKYGKNIDQPRT